MPEPSPMNKKIIVYQAADNQYEMEENTSEAEEEVKQ